MPATIALRYGKNQIPFSYEEDEFEILASEKPSAPLADAEIGTRLDQPIASKPLEEIVGEGESVLIVVPDARLRGEAAVPVLAGMRRFLSVSPLATL